MGGVGCVVAPWRPREACGGSWLRARRVSRQRLTISMYRSSSSSTCSMSNALAPSAAMRRCSSVLAAAMRGRNALTRASKSAGGATRPAASARAARATKRRAGRM